MGQMEMAVEQSVKCGRQEKGRERTPGRRRIRSRVPTRLATSLHFLLLTVLTANIVVATLTFAHYIQWDKSPSSSFDRNQIADA